jgi:hypothetical protein
MAFEDTLFQDVIEWEEGSQYNMWNEPGAVRMDGASGGASFESCEFQRVSGYDVIRTNQESSSGSLYSDQPDMSTFDWVTVGLLEVKPLSEAGTQEAFLTADDPWVVQTKQARVPVKACWIVCESTMCCISVDIAQHCVMSGSSGTPNALA